MTLLKTCFKFNSVLNFRYHAYGKDIFFKKRSYLLVFSFSGEDVGTLRVLKLEKGSLNAQVLFSTSGNQGNEWYVLLAGFNRN